MASDNAVWYVWCLTENLSEKHTGLQARVGPLEGEPEAAGVYEDRGHKFIVDGTEFVKNDYRTIQIEDDTDPDEPIEIVGP